MEIDETKAALPRHKTDVNMTSPWDNGMHERRVKSPSDRAYYSRIYAFLNPDGDPTRKSSYSYIHHMVAADGTPGAANMRALATGIATLNGGRAGTVLRGNDREGVYRHLAAHYRDAGREAPALMPESEIRSINEYLETKGDTDSQIDIGAQISWLDDDGEHFGVVTDFYESKNYLVREWLNDEWYYPTENFVEVFPEEQDVKSSQFINFEIEEKAIEPSTDSTLVTWDTPNGPFFGDVLTVIQSGQMDGQPQGMVLEASEDKPVALVRVWMWDEDEWIPTNTTIVAYSDTLNQVDSLPNPMAEDNMPENDTTDGQTPMGEETDGVKSIEEIALEIAKVLVAAGIKLDPPAGFSNAGGAAQTPSGNHGEEQAEEAQVAASDEPAVEAESAPAEDAPAASEEASAESETVDSAAEPQAEEAAAQPEEQKSTLTLNDLKEFQDLLKVL